MPVIAMIKDRLEDIPVDTRVRCENLINNINEENWWGIARDVVSGTPVGHQIDEASTMVEGAIISLITGMTKLTAIVKKPDEEDDPFAEIEEPLKEYLAKAKKQRPDKDLIVEGLQVVKQGYSDLWDKFEEFINEPPHPPPLATGAPASAPAVDELEEDDDPDPELGSHHRTSARRRR